MNDNYAFGIHFFYGVSVVSPYGPRWIRPEETFIVPFVLLWGTKVADVPASGPFIQQTDRQTDKHGLDQYASEFSKEKAAALHTKHAEG